MEPQTSNIDGGGGNPIASWYQKSSKIRSGVLLWLLGGLGDVLEASWSCPGAVLGASLGSSWGVLGSSWGRLERVGGLLERHVGVLGVS